MTDLRGSGYEFDLFVIGAGSGGVRAARVAAGHGARVAIAEEHKVGGTCVIRGCVPKKLLVYGAHFAEDLKDARRFGWQVPDCSFDWPSLRDGVLGEVERLSSLYEQTLLNYGIETFYARATIAGPHAIRFGDGRIVTAANILVATGGWPVRPDVPGAEHGITSNEIFQLPELPRHIVIAGGGYIANEFAGIFNEFGVEVTLVNRGTGLLRGYDEQIRDRLLEISTAKGIRFRFETEFEAIERLSDRRLLIRTRGGDAIQCDQLLFALGRRPKIGGLGLEAAGVDVDARGAIVVDGENRTACPSIYAVGDVTDRIQLTPVAIREGQAFADRLFGEGASPVDYANVPSAVFSHPPIAAIGMTEAAARALGEIRVFTSDFRPMKNVLAGRNERALYKLIVDASTDRILGLHMIGPDAPEILQAAAVAVKAGLTKRAFDETVALHPTMAEELVLMR